MAFPCEPPVPHYIDDQGVTRDVRTQVACIPYTDGWGFVRDRNTGLKIIVAREETAKIPGIQAGPFQHSRGRESRAWQPTSDDMAKAGMFVNVTSGSTATGSIYGTGHPAPMGWGGASAFALAPVSPPVGPCLSAPRTPEVGPVYHSPHAQAWGGSAGSTACGSSAATSAGPAPMSPPTVHVRGTVSGHPGPKQIRPSPPTPFNTFGSNIG